MSVQGTPFASLTDGSRAIIAPGVTGPAGTFNQIEFTITTGDDNLRDDSAATAILQDANGTTLQSIGLKGPLQPAWDNNSTHEVSAQLSPPLSASAISQVTISLTQHKNGTETDDNWTIQGFSVALSNNGNNAQTIMNAPGTPLARLSGIQSSFTYPPPVAKAGLGMTRPIDPPAETLSQQINPSLPDGVLPWGYNVAPAGFLDANSHMDETCPIPKQKFTTVSKNACLPNWNGKVTEQTGRLNVFLRENAAAQDSKLQLVRAVWLQAGLPLPGSMAGKVCGGTNPACATALAQLSVTGRRSFDSFVAWNSAAGPASSGPQIADLVQLVKQGYKDVPALPANITADSLTAACTAVLNQAYTALWAIRSNDSSWRQYRLNAGWIAVSGEDDSPHRPVNVPTAPFPQFDIPVQMRVGIANFILTGRFMLASKETNMKLTITPTAAPAIPMAGNRFALPAYDPAALLNGALKNRNVIVYIHGGGSRLEEAVPMAQEFVTKFGAWSDNLVVVSFDLPDSAYNDTSMKPVNGGSAVTLDATSELFEDGPNATGPKNFNNYPVLNFTINYINNFLATVGQKGIINPRQVLTIMGGSLGGNTSVLLSLNPLPAPLHLDQPLSFSAPASAPGGGKPTFVSWSPTSMVSVADNKDSVIGANMCCSVLNGSKPDGSGKPGHTWELEGTDTRKDYLTHIYFAETAPGLPADPEMWYRSDWKDAQGRNLTASLITQSRYDRYEIYSPLARVWTTAIDTEQAVYSFQNNTDLTGQSYEPVYRRISGRMLLVAGACDDYDNNPAAAPLAPYRALGIGSCNGIGVGNTGANNLFTHQDIYGFTHDIGADLRNVTGKTLFMNDTGHSVHDERPVFFASQIHDFLTTPDNNINITLRTGSDDLRWNSEVHAIVGYQGGASPLDFPLNYWFHPWPAAGSSPNNPCGACNSLTAFHFAGAASEGTTTVSNFTIALPSNVKPASINSFGIQFIAGTSTVGNTTDEWKLAAVAACIPGSKFGFISDGFPVTGIVHDFKPSSDKQPTLWQPPSFQNPASASRPNNCSAIGTNPPANADVPRSIFDRGFQAGN